MTLQQFYAVIPRRDQRPIYLAGPFDTRAAADAWVRDAQPRAIVLPWPEDHSSEDHDMAKTATRSERPATFEDLLDVPEHLIGEIIDGSLVTHPRPTPKHASAASILDKVLGSPFDRGIGGPGGWRIIFEPRLRLGPHTKVPDLAGWRRERMPKLPATAYFDVVPDWACEFISPSSEEDDRVRKPGIYAEFGIAYYWLGDPNERTLETFVLEQSVFKPTETYRDNDIVAAPPFAEVPFSLGDLWED